jgi:Ca-activated chloride channel family protein
VIVWTSPLAFLLFIPLAAAVVWRFYKRAQRPTLQFSSLGALRAAGSTVRAKLAWIPFALTVLGLALVIAALARPQKADTKVRKNVEGIDIMLVLDISDSMMIEDMKPNRIEACKMIMRDFIKGRVSDRIGFIMFAGESFTRVPLTLDYRLLDENISKVEITRNIKMGTAIGMALADATARLKDSTAASRVIVFLTDGENNSGTIDPDTALQLAKGYGLKIYTIGAGVDGDAQMPVEVIDAFGRKTKTYQPIHSTVNDDLLGRMASETGGKYYRATNTEALRKVFGDINRLEKTKIDVNQYVKYSELYMTWLEFGVGLLIVSRLLAATIFRRGI